MASKRRQERTNQRAAQAGASDTSAEGRLKHLKRSCERFRREHRRGTRIPQALRDAALAALESGTPEGRVRRVCNISRTQLRWWRQSQRTRGQFEPAEQKVRVFEVIEDAADSPSICAI